MRDILSETLKEQAALYVMDALDFDELKEFKRELLSNSELENYVRELKATLQVTDSLNEETADEMWLQEQRNLLRANLAKESPKFEQLVRSTGKQIRHYFDVIFVPKKVSVAIATYAIIAFLAGRYLVPMGTPTKSDSGIDIRKMIQSGLLSNANIQFDANQKHPINVELNTQQDVELSGDINDENIRDLVSYLLLNDKNPGTRIKAADLMENMQPNDEVEMVLISSALSDPNPGIRLRSIRLLQSYPVDALLVNACQKILMADTNEAVRMEAISILSRQPSRKLLPILRLVASSETNSFIRNQARELLYQLNNPANGSQPGDVQ